MSEMTEEEKSLLEDKRRDEILRILDDYLGLSARELYGYEIDAIAKKIYEIMKKYEKKI